MLGKDSEKTRKNSDFWGNVEKGEKWNEWEQSMLSHAMQSRLDGVNAASPPLSLGYAWTEHTSKHFPKFFVNSKLEGGGTKHSGNAAAATFILLLSFFLLNESLQFLASKILSHEIHSGFYH